MKTCAIIVLLMALLCVHTESNRVLIVPHSVGHQIVRLTIHFRDHCFWLRNLVQETLLSCDNAVFQWLFHGLSLSGAHLSFFQCMQLNILNWTLCQTFVEWVVCISNGPICPRIPNYSIFSSCLLQWHNDNGNDNSLFTDLFVLYWFRGTACTWWCGVTEVARKCFLLFSPPSSETCHCILVR